MQLAKPTTTPKLLSYSHVDSRANLMTSYQKWAGVIPAHAHFVFIFQVSFVQFS